MSTTLPYRVRIVPRASALIGRIHWMYNNFRRKLGFKPLSSYKKKTLHFISKSNCFAGAYRVRRMLSSVTAAGAEFLYITAFYARVQRLSAPSCAYLHLVRRTRYYLCTTVEPSTTIFCGWKDFRRWYKLQSNNAFWRARQGMSHCIGLQGAGEPWPPHNNVKNWINAY